MRITIFPDVTGTVAQPYDMPWATLVQSCQVPMHYASKPALPLIKLATFGDARSARGAIRHDANCLTVSGLEGDYDAGAVSPESAAALLTAAGIQSVVYTSPSHTPQAPRWRVLAPLSRECLPAQRRELLARLNGALGGILARESFSISQTFYFGAVTGAPYVAIPVAGQPIDLLVNLPPVYPAGVSACGAMASHSDREADDVALEHLASALDYLAAAGTCNSYLDVIAVGQALCGLGDAGFLLWSAWAARSPKHDPDVMLPKWETFSADRTDWPSVFARASALGWVNPKARKPLDLSAVGFGGAVPVLAATSASPSTSDPRVTVPQPTPINGNTYATAADQPNIFKGCVYVQAADSVLIEGDLLNRSRFDVRYGAFTYSLDRENGKTAKGAWDVFTRSQAVSFPKAHDICFRPELPPATVVREAGRLLANIWWPVETERTPGDVAPFLDHLRRLLPNERDRQIMLAYLAAMVQHVGVKFQWCTVLQGAEGNGKSLLSAVMEHALGARYSHKPNASDLGGNGGKFTAWLRGRLLISIEEIKTENKRELLEILKPLITNDRVEIQGKGQDQVTGDNRANFLMFTNYKDAIPVSIDKRRYAVFYSAQQDGTDWIERDGMGGDYFPRLYGWLRTGGYAHVAHYLATYPIPAELNPATRLMRAPNTSSTAEAVEVSMGVVEQEIRELIESGDTPGLRGGWVSSMVLGRAMAQSNIRRLSPAKLTEALRALGYIHHPALPGGRVHNIVPIPDAGKPRLYLKVGHLSLNEHRPIEIARQYIQSQGVGIGVNSMQNVSQNQ